MLAEIFSENPVPYPYFVGNVPPETMQADFDGRVDILPVSDPNIFSMSQRLSLAQTQLQMAQAAPQMHNLREAYRRMYDALDIKNIDAILPEPPQPQPTDPATENGNALKGMPLQAFPEQDHEAHVRAHIPFLANPASQANPQGYLMLHAHVQDHIGMMARDQVTTFFQKSVEAAQMEGQPVPQINPAAVEAAIAQQTGEILNELLPSLAPQAPEDPLVEIRKKELENDTAELQRKTMNDQMNFQVDSAKIQQAYDLAQQRQRLQEEIANDRNDVNVYRINMAAASRGNKGK